MSHVEFNKWQCRMSLSPTNPYVRLSNLRNDNVACHYWFTPSCRGMPKTCWETLVTCLWNVCNKSLIAICTTCWGYQIQFCELSGKITDWVTDPLKVCDISSWPRARGQWKIGRASEKLTRTSDIYIKLLRRTVSGPVKKIPISHTAP